ncbi:hypothetical protein B0F90DRAFT_1677766 [Multifurca ochricompacta]|uniref:protein-tyrosine-phosphatase n=1 Tax=Multifurca ochricompacta TaxID=376703 RepID=A0AAD4MCX9_9AGAM|nr:hypothetical protein B0F90DRAFT_1677766 [Multifurca ochricompacta]
MLPSPIPTPVPRRKGPPSGLHIDTPARNITVALAPGYSSASTSAVSPTTSESGSFQFPPPPQRIRSRNMKKLSLALSTQSSSSSLAIPPNYCQVDHVTQEARSRRTSIIWLGAEDNVADWRGLVTRRIGSILNVAKEVVSPFDSLTPAEGSHGDSMAKEFPGGALVNQGAYYPADATGRPGSHYLKLQWSHGQTDLVQRGFPEAMAFVDQSLARGEGVLIHCQCGISRSATLVIALVMRAASLRSPLVPQEVWDLKGMQAAYGYVKQKSKWVGPNMSLIYQLLDYEKVLRGPSRSPTPSERSQSEAAADEEWVRRRKMLDDNSDREEIAEKESESMEMQREAKALDKAMEDRILARKLSSSSIGSSNGNGTGTGIGIGMGPAWKSRYSARKRTGSIASNMTGNSVLSENLVEEDEEEELLGIGGGFDKSKSSSARPLLPPPPPPPHSLLMSLMGNPQTRPAVFKKVKARRRPTPLDIDILPTVPDSPINLAPPPPPPPPPLVMVNPRTPRTLARTRKESRATRPLHLVVVRNSTPSPSLSSSSSSSQTQAQAQTQTLFVFPPSPTLSSTCTPSAMTLTSTSNSISFPSSSTPRSNSDSRRRSLIGLMMPPTPTTAHARVDARGWVGIH